MPTIIDSYSIALLDNLNSRIDEVRLNDNLRIARIDLISDIRAVELLGEQTFSTSREIREKGRLSENEFRALRYANPLTHSIVTRMAELSNHALEWHSKGEVPDPFNDHYDRHLPQKIFNNVVTSLRLLKPGIVGRFPTHNIIRGDPSGLETWCSSEELFYQPSLLNWPEQYQLNTGDIERLTQLFNAVNEFGDMRMGIALSRFNRQYARDDDVDKLIDLLVGFESLYLRENDELKIRLATRVATHLGDDSTPVKTRKILYQSISTAYRLRSNCIHGSLKELEGHALLVKGCWESPYYMLEQLSSLLREAICDILLNVKKESFKKAFLDQIDDKLFPDFKQQ